MSLRNNQEERKAYAQAYYKKHKEELKIASSARYETKKTEILAKNKIYRETHKEEAKLYQKPYRESHKDKQAKAHMKWRKSHQVRWWAGLTLRQHKKRDGYIIHISMEELEQIGENTKFCPICGIEIDWGIGNKGKAVPNSPSLDRKYNEQELNKNNVWVICWRCNQGKNKGTLEEYIDHCKRVATKNSSKM